MLARALTGVLDATESVVKVDGTSYFTYNTAVNVGGENGHEIPVLLGKMSASARKTISRAICSTLVYLGFRYKK